MGTTLLRGTDGAQPPIASVLASTPLSRLVQCRLKYCTSRSCCLAASSVANVPKLRGLPVCAFFFREYKRNCPDLSFRIMNNLDADRRTGVARRRRESNGLKAGGI